MTSEAELLKRLNAINQSAPFNRWLGFEVSRAAPGEVDLRLDRRPEHGQYSDLLHVGIVAALIDTCCGFAAATLVERVLASHFSIDCLAPALGQSFLAKGRVLKSGRRQIFASAELHAIGRGTLNLVAVGSAVLVPIDQPGSST
jgi:uncharacterized protein (TIGR00369 family)